MTTGIVLIVAGLLFATWPTVYHRQMEKVRVRATERGQLERFDAAMDHAWIRTFVRGWPIIGLVLVIVGVLSLVL